ncbi:MAG: hypothetical protein WBP46_05620 [Thiolinea sp.]
MRSLFILTGLVLLALCAGFFFRWPWALSLWPWEDGKLSYLFLASICAGTALPLFWIAAAKEYAAVRAGSLDFAVTYSGLFATLLITYPAVQEWIAPSIAIGLCLGSLLLNLLLYAWSRKIPFRYAEPIPQLLHVSFGLFFIAIMIVGISLIMRLPHIFPWPLKPQTSIVFGWIYLGAAMYFLYGFIYPVWGNVKGQLAGFLAYDLVLIWPFTQHLLATVKPEHQLSLIIYLGVLIYSAILAIYYLFIHRPSRLLA